MNLDKGVDNFIIQAYNGIPEQGQEVVSYGLVYNLEKNEFVEPENGE